MTVKTDQEAVAFALLKQHADREKARICGDHVFETDENGLNPYGQVMYMPRDGELVTVMYGPKEGLTRLEAYQQIAEQFGARLTLASESIDGHFISAAVGDFTEGLFAFRDGHPFSESWPKAQCLAWNLAASHAHGFGGDLVEEPAEPPSLQPDPGNWDDQDAAVGATCDPVYVDAEPEEQVAYSHYDDLLARLKARPEVKHVAVNKIGSWGRSGDVSVVFMTGGGYTEDWAQKRTIGPRNAEEAMQNILDRLEREDAEAAVAAVAGTFPEGARSTDRSAD